MYSDDEYPIEEIQNRRQNAPNRILLRRSKSETSLLAANAETGITRDNSTQDMGCQTPRILPTNFMSKRLQDCTEKMEQIQSEILKEIFYEIRAEHQMETDDQLDGDDQMVCQTLENALINQTAKQLLEEFEKSYLKFKDKAWNVFSSKYRNWLSEDEEVRSLNSMRIIFERDFHKAFMDKWLPMLNKEIIFSLRNHAEAGTEGQVREGEVSPELVRTKSMNALVIGVKGLNIGLQRAADTISGIERKLRIIEGENKELRRRLGED